MEKPKNILWRDACLVMLGLLAITGLIALLMDVMDQHLKQAENISRQASWKGQPVGVMPQINTATAHSDAFEPVNALITSTP